MSAAIESAPVDVDDNGPSTSRTHDGVTGHSVAASVAPPSPSQSAYTPAQAPPAVSETEEKEEASAAAVPATTSSSPSPSASASATPQSQSRALTKTQPLVARPPSRPASESGSRVSSRASRRPGSSKLVPLPTSAASKLPFYAQALVTPSPSSVQPLPPQHMASLPLSAALAHISKANAEGLELMRRKEYQQALERLKRAEAFCSAPVVRRERGGAAVTLRASTLNNIAILLKSVHQLRPALSYADRALRLEINFVPDPYAPTGPRPNPAGTHLNMCAILSALSRHGSALLHAECALSSLYLELHQMAAQAQHLKRQRAAQQQAEEEERGGEDGSEYSPSPADPSQSPARASILSLIAVAYLNAATEQEFLRQFRASTHSYRRAYEFAAKRLGPDHHLTLTIAHAYEGAANLHPLKVTAPDQSMDPHTKLTVANAEKAAVTLSTPLKAKKNRWLKPSLENDAMTARHVPVCLVPWNQFVAVSGLPGREPRAATSQHQRGTSDSTAYTSTARLSLAPGGQSQRGRRGGRTFAEEKASEEFEDENGDYDETGDDAQYGPRVSEAELRARHADQSRLLGPPSHAPPSGVMNAEEGAPGSADHEDAGYWSDPELSDLPALGGKGTKGKMDPRSAALRLNGRARNGQTLPSSSSAGTLLHAQRGGPAPPQPMPVPMQYPYQQPYAPYAPYAPQSSQPAQAAYSHPYAAYPPPHPPQANYSLPAHGPSSYSSYSPAPYGMQQQPQHQPYVAAYARTPATNGYQPHATPYGYAR